MNAQAGQVTQMTIWDGAVGSGTQLQLAQTYSPAANTGAPATVVAVPSTPPAAGSKTYRVGLAAPFAGNTSLISASSTAPAFILVELI